MAESKEQLLKLAPEQLANIILKERRTNKALYKAKTELHIEVKDLKKDKKKLLTRIANQKETIEIQDKELEIKTHGALTKQVGGDHYKLAIQPVEFITKNNIGFIEGNIIKYATRHKHKNGVEDIKKIIHYAELLLQLTYSSERLAKQAQNGVNYPLTAKAERHVEDPHMPIALYVKKDGTKVSIIPARKSIVAVKDGHFAHLEDQEIDEALQKAEESGLI